MSGAVFAGLVTTLRPDGDSASHGPATIDTRCLRRAIYEFGCVVIRGFIPKPDVELYAGIAERTFDTCRQMLQIRRCRIMVELRMGAVAWPCGNARFPSPLIEPDVRISRIRLSDWLHREAHGKDH